MKRFTICRGNIMGRSFRSAIHDGWIFIHNGWKFIFISLFISLDCYAQSPLAVTGSFKPLPVSAFKSSLVSTFKPSPVSAFKPSLVSATLSADMVNPVDELIVTLAWQNTGTRGSAIPLKGFVELQFGHQRIEEGLKKNYRYYYELFPDPSEWKDGDVWKVSCKIPISTREFWGGSYEVTTGLCDADDNPYPFRGKKATSTMQEKLGEVQIGWGYGSLAVAGTLRPIKT